VLLWFSVAGCLVPLVLMALGPERMGAAGGLGVVALFASGLAALTVYLAVEVRRLSRP
jgi:hypothetical protein